MKKIIVQNVLLPNGEVQPVSFKNKKFKKSKFQFGGVLREPQRSIMCRTPNQIQIRILHYENDGFYRWYLTRETFISDVNGAALFAKAVAYGWSNK